MKYGALTVFSVRAPIFATATKSDCNRSRILFILFLSNTKGG